MRGPVSWWKSRRAAADFRDLVEPSGLFDQSWYLRQYPEAAASGQHPFQHYILEGWQKGHSPGPSFDAAWYLDYYRDVAESGGEPLLHFIRHGAAEGRKTNAAGVAVMEFFHSLGDNCEFGFVQRRLGAEPLDLFRFAGTNIDGLIVALESRLSDLVSPGGLALEFSRCADGRSEYFIRAKRYGVVYHGADKPARVDFDDFEEAELKRVRLLCRKFIEDLEEGRKIFVYKSNVAPPTARIDDLVAAMRRYGPATLLWVTGEDVGRSSGMVEEISDGLLRGYIDRFAPYGNANDYSLDAWQMICHNAYNLRLARHRPNGAA
jgi:hypothetical protein